MEVDAYRASDTLEMVIMTLHFFHLFLAMLFVAATLADLFFVRSPSSEAIVPRELVLAWRKRIGLAQMFLFLAVFALGLSLWMPLATAYPPQIFHTKISLGVLYLILVKVRMFKERKKGLQVGLTRAQALVALVIFALGAIGGLTA